MRLNRSSLRSGGALRAVLTAPMLALVVACGGGGAAPPTPTAAATVSVVAPPAASPQRPALVSPAASPSAGLSAPGATLTPGAADSAGETYEVQSGDTLATIAQDKYGDATLWRRIYDANKDAIGSDPDKLKLGMQLKIPPKQP